LRAGFAGCSGLSRLVGVIEAEQTEGRTVYERAPYRRRDLLRDLNISVRDLAASGQ